MAYKIVHKYWTECSVCGGNAELDEDSHIHGGLTPGSGNPTKYWIENSQSTLDHENGCGAIFNQPKIDAIY